VTAAFFLRQDVHFGFELGVRRDRARLARTWPRSTSSRFDAAQQRADVVASFTLVEQLAEHFDAGAGRLLGVRMPTISTSSPTLTMPRSTRPVTTVPRPEIENTSSIGIRNGLSIGRSGCGM
jgi:hypothetical protein